MPDSKLQPALSAKHSVSLVIIDTESYELALRAVNQSVERFAFDRVLVFSDDETQWGNYSVTKIPKLTRIDQFNEFIIKALPKYIETDFFLVIQFDGFILNANEFNPEFYNCDYIGAPWYFFKTMNVGNGGFSWRSRKLAQAVAQFRYDPVRWPEDAFIGRKSRSRLEHFYNCHFASSDLAAHFSVENQMSPHPTFGFHGLHLLPQAYQKDMDFLIQYLPRRIFLHQPRFNLLAGGVKMFAPDSLNALEAKRNQYLQANI